MTNCRGLCRAMLVAVTIFAATPGAFAATNASPALPTQYNVRDFGAMGDERHDDTAAFQRALDLCHQKRGGIVFVPPGRYLLKGTLTIPEAVTLKGTFEAPPTVSASLGTMLLTTAGKGEADGTPFITMYRNATLKGLQIFYPEQNKDIVPYPWCVRGVGDNCSIIHVLMMNPYQAVDFGTIHPAGRHYINGLYAQALKTGLFIDKCFDVGRVENVHFWPFWSTEKVITDWTAANGTAFVIGRTDWEYMVNCFTISYNIGFHFIGRADGPGNAVLTQCGADVGPIAVKVDGLQPHSGASFSNSQFMAGIDVGSQNMGPLKFTSCGFWGVETVTDTHAFIRGGGHVSFSNCHFTWWGRKNRTAPAILGESGSFSVVGCEFLDDDPQRVHIELREDVEAAVIMGNRFRTQPRIINHSEGNVEIVGNVGGKRSRMAEALQDSDTSAVASLWGERLARRPMETYDITHKLASAVMLDDAHRDLREKLLRSAAESTATGELESFARRAKQELELDASGKSFPKRVVATRAPSPPSIDGRPDDPAWKSAQWVETTATQTRYALLWDTDALYFAADAAEPTTSSIRVNTTKRDGPVWDDDSVELFLSPRRAIDRYLQMIINAGGAFYDGSGTLRGTDAKGWETSATVAAARTESGWSAEARIAWSDMNTSAPAAGETWTADFRRWRHAGGSRDITTWSGAPEGGAHHHPEAFGLLQFK